jgi:NADPH-dependent curcumin reductase CurA
MSKWIAEGKIKWKENIFERLESVPKAFVSLFKGESVGRILVKLRPYTEK